MTSFPQKVSAVSSDSSAPLVKDCAAILMPCQSFFQKPHDSCSASRSVASVIFCCSAFSDEKASPMVEVSSEMLPPEHSAMSLVKMFTTPSKARQTIENSITQNSISSGRSSCHPKCISPCT